MAYGTRWRGAPSNCRSARGRSRASPRVARSPPFSCSVLVEVALDLPRVTRLEQRQAQEHPRFLWVLVVRRHEAEAVVLHLDVTAHLTRRDASGADADDAALRLRGERVERLLRHVAIADARDDDALRARCGGRIDQRAVHVL